MTVKIGINGFGRIGRNYLRAALAQGADLEIVAVNDLTDNKSLAHLLKYDSVGGVLTEDVSYTADSITVGGQDHQGLRRARPRQPPLGRAGRRHRHRVDRSLHQGRRRQEAHHRWCQEGPHLGSATGDDATIVMGVNEETYNPETDVIISNASCTTNCLAPLAQVFNEAFGIERGFMMTAHAYTADQNLQDGPHSDLRRARGAAINIVPASTGAAKAIGLVLPELNGKLSGSSYRVPVPTGSIVDLTIVTPTEGLTVDQVNEVYKKAAAEGRLNGILQYTEDPIVSSDIQGNPHSSIFDAELTNVSGNLVKVSSWYDNEWGYSNRLVDLTST